MMAWDVIRKGKVIDTVFFFFGEGHTAEEVRKSLIEHDGYPTDIIVVPSTR